MFTDATLSLVPLGAPLSLVGASGVAIPSPLTIDLAGVGVGVAPPNIIGTNVTVFGTDMGVGEHRPEMNITIGTALAAAGGTTLKVALQAAQDTGAAGGYQPGTWLDLVSQDNITVANAVAGAVIARFPWIPEMPPNFQPRFLRLLFSPQTTAAGVTTTPGGDFTAGTIASALVTTVRDDYSAKYQPRNYAVA